MSIALVAAIACVPAFVTGLAVTRLEGALLLAGYAGYVAYLFVAGNGAAS